MQWPRVQARAIVDVGDFPVDIELQAFLVTCWGELSSGEALPRRVYQIGALSEDIAGRAGLDLYVNEMERPN